MPGFYISDVGNSIGSLSACSNDCIRRETSCDTYQVKACTLPKFLNDKCLIDNESYVIIAEGVILNKTELQTKYQAASVGELIQRSYELNGETFFSSFRGSFSGGLYIKKEKKWIVYTNHYGDSMVFYSLIDANIIISSQVDWILETLRLNNKPISVDTHAIHSLLTYGYMSHDRTYANEIKRLYPGHYIVYQQGDLRIERFFSVQTGKYDLSDKTEAEMIEEMDGAFRHAVALEYEKDKEYGYRHLAQISGGLDSRMSLWVAHDMGYKDIQCMTFAQSKSLDEVISGQITDALGYPHISWQLDTAEHLFNIDGYIAMNYGLAIYGGIGAEREILDSLDMKQYGVVHTGQLGDVVFGCFLNDEKELKDMSAGGVYSKYLEPETEVVSRFGNREEYLMFVRGFMGCLSSHLYTRNYTEVASPFLDVDLLDHSLSIPVEKRKKHQLYKKWILEKYPQAAEYIWEKTGKRIDQKDHPFADRAKRVIKDPKLVLKKLGFKVRSDNSLRTGMNPMDLWWETNEVFRSTYDEYFKENISSEFLPEKYRTLIRDMYSTGTVIDKMLCITVLASLKLYFDVRSKDGVS